MTREILFRGKRIDNGEWVYGCVLKDYITGQYFIHACGNSVYESDKTGEEGLLRFVAYEVDPETVCQYTGLNDKNGRKIFDGDIEKDRSCDLYTVNWSDENGMYEVRQYNCSMTNFETFFACGCEVIGNIYDNPELMEVC